ncbi:MAG: hypothetical protein AB4041_04465 [Microcystaceae cyanobacterium]
MTTKSSTNSAVKYRLSAFDKWVIGISGLLMLSIIGVWWQGDPTQLKVSDFSWENTKIDVQDKFFTFTFNRPVKRSQIEKNLTIEPNLDGKISWHNNQLFYTLTDLPIYGSNYQFSLPEIAAQQNPPLPSQPFTQVVGTPDRAFIYIGVRGEERGRLILLNITDTETPKKTILTPRHLVVTDFAIYPQGDRILFSAYEPNLRSLQSSRQQLLIVTTGLSQAVDTPSTEAGRLQEIFAEGNYDNLKFDLSKDGTTIVVLRQNRQNPAEIGLWVKSSSNDPRPLGFPADQFLVSPDGKTVSLVQENGVSIVPLEKESGNPQFLANYEQLIGFTLDGRQQLLVRRNRDYTRSLVLLDKQNQTKDIFRTIHPISQCQFDPRNINHLYCVKVDLIPQENGSYTEEPFLSLLNLKTGQDIPLLALPNDSNVQLSLSPDGIALLFDQVSTQTPRSSNDLLTNDQKAIIEGQIWGFPLPNIDDQSNKQSISIAPQALETGYQPLWIP